MDFRSSEPKLSLFAAPAIFVLRRSRQGRMLARRIRLFLWIIGVLIPVLATPLSGQDKPPKTPSRRSQASAPMPQSPKEAIERIRRSLILVETFSSDGTPIAIGSGFALATNPNPMFVTNLHVLKWAQRATIKTLADGVRYKVTEVLGVNVVNDYCFLIAPGANAVGVELGNANAVSVGDRVIAAGNPKGLEATFSSGIISAIRQKPKRLQIDAPISPGSSGGPVFNFRGEVIGIAVSTLLGGQNLNFAIPIDNEFGFDEVRFSVKTAAVISLNDVEVEHLKGRPRSLEERYLTGRWNPRTRQFVEGQAHITKKFAFNEDGMLTRTGFEDEAQIEYRKPRVIRTVSHYENGRLVLDHDLSQREGYVFRENVVHFGDTAVEGNEEGPDQLRRGDTSAKPYFARRYDAYGNEVAWECWHWPSCGSSDEDVLFRIDMSYDEDNKVIKSVGRVNGQVQETYKYLYSFDQVGNWIRQMRLLVTDTQPNGVPVEVVYRAFTYY